MATLTHVTLCSGAESVLRYLERRVECGTNLLTLMSETSERSRPPSLR